MDTLVAQGLVDYGTAEERQGVIARLHQAATDMRDLFRSHHQGRVETWRGEPLSSLSLPSLIEAALHMEKAVRTVQDNRKVWDDMLDQSGVS